MKDLILIGYWRSEEELFWPDPAWFVDEKLTEEEIKMTVDYLKNGRFMPYASAGTSWCRFRCEEGILGSKEQTDGKNLWPEKLWHYVEKHKVRLPSEFIENIRERRKMPDPVDEEFNINTEWWINQKGWDQDKSSFLKEDSYGKMTIRFMNPNDRKTNISFLKSIDKYKDLSLQDLLNILTANNEIYLFCMWTDFRKLQKIKTEGIELDFEERYVENENRKNN